MIESIGGIISLFNGLKNGLTGSWETLKKGKRKKIIRKLVVLKITLEDIIESAEEIFASIEMIIQAKRTSKEDLELFKERIRTQSYNLRVLLNNFRDPISEKILKTFNPELRRNIEKHTHEKRSRINYFMYNLYDLKATNIRKKYNKEYLEKGYAILNNLKETSAEFTLFVNKHASIEDIL